MENDAESVGWGRKILFVTGQPFGVVRHLRPNSRIPRLPSKMTDPGNGFDSSVTN